MKFTRHGNGHNTSNACDDAGSYGRFAEAVKERTRFIFDETTSRFIDRVRHQSPSRLKSIAKDTQLWRSRVANAWAAVKINEDEFIEEPAPCALNDMIPKVEHTLAGGRANPPGIVCLYVATTPETALAEARPALKQSVTLGLGYLLIFGPVMRSRYRISSRSVPLRLSDWFVTQQSGSNMDWAKKSRKTYGPKLGKKTLLHTGRRSSVIHRFR
ncbi:MAG: RES family NAD+ phosphorylase [Verrucomicrobiales bacterium]|nr:RES family NAD+ phosphorylase [Verrucomicrobiales bacterium]